MSNVVSVSSKPYGKTASWYDAIYAARGRDADAEVESLSRYFEADGQTVQTRRLLDVGCGTGVHLRALSRYGTVEGVDPSSSMLEVARARAAGVRLHRASLPTMSLGRQFDVVTSLFGVIGYAQDEAEALSWLQTLGAHVSDSGVLLIEPPLFAEQFEPGESREVSTTINGSRLRRTASATRDRTHLNITFTWQGPQAIAAAQSIGEESITERHRLLLLTSSTWKSLLDQATPSRPYPSHHLANKTTGPLLHSPSGTHTTAVALSDFGGSGL